MNQTSTQPKKFSEFNIEPEHKGFRGDKIDVHSVLNTQIEVHDYKIGKSKFENKGQCLTLQIKIGDKWHVIFSSSVVLMELIAKVKKEDFPFITTIVLKDRCLKFT